MANPSLTKFLDELKSIPEKLAKLITAFIAGVEKELTSVKGILLIVLGGALVIDLIMLGRIGIVAHTVKAGENVITIVFEAIKGKVVELILIVVLFALIKKS